MKLTYADTPSVSELTFKKLLLTSSELVFVERPSINLATDYGTVGVHSNLRPLVKELEGSAVNLSVTEPPNTTMNSEFYRGYFRQDLLEKEFLNTIIEGIRSNWIYDHHFKDEAGRCKGEFKDYRKWILDNVAEIISTNLSDIDTPKGEPFSIATLEEALFTFKIIAAEQSLRVTSILHSCNEFDNSPISENPFLDKLINLRTTNENYVGVIPPSRSLGLKIIDIIMSDEALHHIHWTDILSFRERTKKLFDNWEVEINKIESKIPDMMDLSSLEIQKLYDREINPELKKLENEIQQMRDDQFKNILKTVKNVVLSSISLGTLSGLTIPGAVASFIGLNLKTPEFTDALIDTHFKLKEKKRFNGFTYLLELKKLI